MNRLNYQHMFYFWNLIEEDSVSRAIKKLHRAIFVRSTTRKASASLPHITPQLTDGVAAFNGLGGTVPVDYVATFTGRRTNVSY